MKAYYLLFFLFAFAFSSSAQQKLQDKKVATTVIGIAIAPVHTITTQKQLHIARIHKFKGDRVKKALTFEIKENTNRAV